MEESGMNCEPEETCKEGEEKMESVQGRWIYTYCEISLR